MRAAGCGADPRHYILQDCRRAGSVARSLPASGGRTQHVHPRWSRRLYLHWVGAADGQHLTAAALAPGNGAATVPDRLDEKACAAPRPRRPPRPGWIGAGHENDCRRERTVARHILTQCGDHGCPIEIRQHQVDDEQGRMSRTGKLKRLSTVQRDHCVLARFAHDEGNGLRERLLILAISTRARSMASSAWCVDVAAVIPPPCVIPWRAAAGCSHGARRCGR